MKVLVCGGRNTGDFEVPRFIEILHELKPTIIISGEARGFDSLAKNYAKVFGVGYKGYHAEWNTYGKSAGYRRNLQMAEDAKPDLVVAFPGGRGTANMVAIAKEKGIPVKVIKI